MLAQSMYVNSTMVHSFIGLDDGRAYILVIEAGSESKQQAGSTVQSSTEQLTTM